jgi:predicted small secreted protein
MKSISKALVLICVVCSLGFLTACNTVHGAGEDISASGHAIQKAAS